MASRAALIERVGLEAAPRVRAPGAERDPVRAEVAFGLASARPEGLRPEQVQRLQSTVGNAAVAQLLSGGGARRPIAPRPLATRAAVSVRPNAAAKAPSSAGPQKGVSGPTSDPLTTATLVEDPVAVVAGPVGATLGVQRSACGCDCGGRCAGAGKESAEKEAADAPVQTLRVQARRDRTPVQRIGLPNPLDALKKLAQKVAGAVRALGAKAKAAASSLGSALAGKARAMGSSIVGKIGSAASAAWGAVQSTGSAIANGARSAVAGVKGALQGVVSTVSNGVRAAGSKLLSWGRSKASSLISGVMNAGSAAFGAAKGWVTGALAKMRAKGQGLLAKAKSAGTWIYGQANKASGGLLGQAVRWGTGVAAGIGAGAAALAGKARSLGKQAWAKVKANPCQALAALTPIGLLSRTALGGAVKKLGAKAKDGAKRVAGQLKSAGSTALALLTNQKGARTKLVQGTVAKAKAVIKGLGSKLLGQAKAKGSRMLGRAKSLGSTLLNGAANLAQRAIGAAMAKVTGMHAKATQFGTKVAAAARAGGEKVKAFAQKVGQTALKTANNLKSTAVGLIGKLSPGLASKVDGLASKAIAKASGVLSWVMGIAQSAASAAMSTATKLASAALSAVTTAGMKVLSKASAFVSKAKAAAEKVAGKVLSAAKTAGTWLVSKAKAAGSKVLSGIRKVGSSVASFVKTKAAAALSKAKEWGGKALSWVGSGAKSLWSGIVSFGGKAFSKIKGWGGKALSLAKKGIGAARARLKALAGPKLWGIAAAAGAAAKGVLDKALAGAKAVGKKAAGAVGCLLKAAGIDPKKLDMVLDFIPVVSNIKDAFSAITGINPITGAALSPAERALAAAFAIPGYGNAVKYAAKGTKLAMKATRAIVAPLLRAGAKVGPLLVKGGEWTAKKAQQMTEWLGSRLKGGTDVGGDALSATKHADDIPKVDVPKALHEPTVPKGHPGAAGSKGPGKGGAKGPKGSQQLVKVPVGPKVPKGPKGGGKGPSGSKGPSGKGPDLPPKTHDPAGPKGPSPEDVRKAKIKAETDRQRELARTDEAYRDEMRRLSEGQPGVGKDAIRWGPATGPGPLDLADANSFRSATYIEEVTTEPIRLYRYSGGKGKAGEFGPFWSTEPPSGALSNQLDAAVLPEWNDFTKLTVIEVPAGTRVFRGPAGGQVSNTHKLPGGGDQIFIPRDVDKAPWKVNSGPAKNTDDVVKNADEIPIKSKLADGGELTKNADGTFTVCRVCEAVSEDDAVKAANGFAEASGILRDAALGKGNYGLGSATASKADELGLAWVRPNYQIASDGKTLVSADGLRQYRAPSFKKSRDRAQANFERRYRAEGQWQANGHLDISG